MILDSFSKTENNSFELTSKVMVGKHVVVVNETDNTFLFRILSLSLIQKYFPRKWNNGKKLEKSS